MTVLKAMAMKEKRRGSTALLMGAAILWVAHSVGAQSGETFKARLSPVPIDLTMRSTIAGSGSVTAVLVGRKLSITGTFAGLRSPATIARLHRGPKGIRGPAIFELTASQAMSGTISGSLDLTPAQVDDLRNDRFYVQIYSERAPEGNLWGWLLR
jgi:hypothetical protein